MFARLFSWLTPGPVYELMHWGWVVETRFPKGPRRGAIAARSLVQLDGDEVTRLTPELLAAQSGPLLAQHRQRVERARQGIETSTRALARRLRGLTWAVAGSESIAQLITQVGSRAMTDVDVLERLVWFPVFAAIDGAWSRLTPARSRLEALVCAALVAITLSLRWMLPAVGPSWLVLIGICGLWLARAWARTIVWAGLRWTVRYRLSRRIDT